MCWIFAFGFDGLQSFRPRMIPFMAEPPKAPAPRLVGFSIHCWHPRLHGLLFSPLKSPQSKFQQDTNSNIKYQSNNWVPFIGMCSDDFLEFVVYDSRNKVQLIAAK